MENFVNITMKICERLEKLAITEQKFLNQMESSLRMMNEELNRTLNELKDIKEYYK